MPCVKESFVVGLFGSRVHEGLILTSSANCNPIEHQQWLSSFTSHCGYYLWWILPTPRFFKITFFFLSIRYSGLQQTLWCTVLFETRPRLLKHHIPSMETTNIIFIHLITQSHIFTWYILNSSLASTLLPRLQLMADIASIDSFISIPKKEIVCVFRSAVSHFAGMNAINNAFYDCWVWPNI